MTQRPDPSNPWGIETEFVDALGRKQTVSEEAYARLSAVFADAPRLEHTGPLPEVVVTRTGEAARLRLSDASEVTWTLQSGDTRREGRAQGDLTLPELAQGTYRLELRTADGRTHESVVLASPPRAYQQPVFDHGGRVWMLAVQLYGVRSARNWGMGDFTDLKELLRLCAEIGAAGVGLNPLHALFDDRPDDASPYAPNSRLFLNVLYIDVEAIPEFPGASALGLTDTIARARGADAVDYPHIGAAKTKALRAAYEAFRNGASEERQADFAAYRQERGEALQRFAAFEVLRRRFKTVWWEWPEEFRRGDAAALSGLARTEAEELGYYEFLQWTAERQLAACAEEARRLGLAVGLYVDVAVGVESGGADAWADQDTMLRGISVGAPPDLLNTAGQDWGITGFNPQALVATGFDAFRRTIAASMHSAGAIRLDHVIGLSRLYLIPHGSKSGGAYVRFPLEALLAVAAQESHRAECLLIGEDLGTVPDDLRGKLSAWNVWRYLVMLFETNERGEFRPPRDYAPQALVTFSTHDLPTFSGWSSDHDLRVKRALGMDPGETDESRRKARREVEQALGRERLGVLNFEGVARFLARSRSGLLVISMEDALGIVDQPNVPGTIRQHPNWRQRLPVSLEDLRCDARLQRLAKAMAEEGRSRRRSGAS